MGTFLLAIPSKRTEEVNWVKYLNSYLLSIHGNTTEYQDDLNKFHKLRQDIRSANPDGTGMKLHYKYYSQLELLDLRISFTAVNKNRKVRFTWYDAFEPSEPYTQSALPFEKACVLFNLGAILSKIATAKYYEFQNQKSTNPNDDTIKDSIQLLQQAAGVYGFIAENFLNAPSGDLSQLSVRFLVKLVLAQAQEIFLLKAISGDLEQKKNSLIAKLSRSVSNFFSECTKMLNAMNNSEDESSSELDNFKVVDSEEGVDFLGDKGPDNGTLDSENGGFKSYAEIDELWMHVCDFKSLYYNANSHYFQGLYLEGNRKYGEAIAYFTKASDILNEFPHNILKSLSKSGLGGVYELHDNYKYQKDLISIKLTELNKDNDFIYHEIIPSLVTLPEVKPMDAVKTTPLEGIPVFQAINEYNYNNFFKNVIPINIHELLSYYSEEKSQYLRNEIDLVETSEEDATSALDSLGLPESFFRLKELVKIPQTGAGEDDISTGLDAETKDIIHQICANFHKDEMNKDLIFRRRKEVHDKIGEIERKISSNPYAYGRQRDDLISLKKFLLEATNFDNKLFGMMQDQGDLYRLLGKGVNSSEVRQFFITSGKEPGKPHTDNEMSLLDIDFDSSEPQNEQQQADKKIQSVTEILNDIQAVKDNKRKLIEILKKEIHADDISDILVLNSKVKSTNEMKTVIFPEELKKFDVYAKELDKNVAQQECLIDMLKSEWLNLNNEPYIKKTAQSSSQCKEYLASQRAKVHYFYSSYWLRYSKGLNAGVDFYGKLLNQAAEIKALLDSPQDSSSYMSDKLNDLSLGSRPYVSLPPASYARPPPALPPKGFSASPTLLLENAALSALNPDKNLNISSSKRGNDLIYDQPSTYLPNMYDFFSKS